MGYPTLTYTLTNGTTADATQVMQNFNDLLNGISDGTKDISINAATIAGTATLNGTVNLGNSSGDDLVVNASLASSLAIKTNNSYDIGAATLAPASIYLGAPSSRSTRLRAHQSLGASNTLIFPNGNGNAGQKLQTDGSGNMSWAWQGGYVSKNDDYAVLDTDGYNFIDVTVVNKTITLPTAADNTNRMITIRKFVSGNGTTTIKGESAGETVDGISGSTGIVLDWYKESVTLICTGSAWEVMHWDIPRIVYTLTVSTSGWTPSISTGVFTKDRSRVFKLSLNITGVTTDSSSKSSFSITIANVTFKSGVNQAITGGNNGNASMYSCITGSNSGSITQSHSSAATSEYYFSGEVQLEAKSSLIV